MHTFRLRELEVSLSADDADIDTAVACLVNHADESMTPARHLRFHLARRDDGGVDTAENDGAPLRSADLAAALTHVHYRIGVHVFAVYEPFTFLHSGAVTIDGRLVMFTGNSGAGKTTLILRLALDGAEFHCDEFVLATADGIVRTVPRHLHVKPGTLDCVPEVATMCFRVPTLQLPGGKTFYPLDLSSLGIQWRSTDRRPAAIVHLVPDFDGAPEARRIPAIESVKRLFGQALTSHRDFGRQGADICGVVRGVPSYELRVGDLGETTELVRRLVEGLPGVS